MSVEIGLSRLFRKLQKTVSVQVMMRGNKIVAYNVVTGDKVVESDDAGFALQAVLDYIVDIGGIVFLYDTFKIYRDLILKLQSYKPVAIVGRHYWLSGIVAPEFRKLIIDGSEITHPGKNQNYVLIHDIKLGMGISTKNMDGKGWYLHMERVYTTASLGGSSGYGMDLKNMYGVIRDSWITYAGMTEPGGTFRITYDTGDADTHIENTTFLIDPTNDNTCEIVRIEAPQGICPTNVKLVDVHTGTPGSGTNRARYALYLWKLSRFIGRNLYLEGFADKQIVLDRVFNSVIEAQSPLKILSINGASVNVIIADFDIEVERDATDQRNIYIIRQAVSWEIFNPQVGTNNTYGPAYVRNFLRHHYAPPQRLVGATIIINNVATGETVTVKIETVDVFNKVRSIEKSYTASGTYMLTANDLQSLLNPWGGIREIRAYAKSDQPSTTATVTIYIYG